MEMNNIFFPTALQTSIYNVPIGSDDNRNPKKLSRKNPWGSRSYADLITQAIETSPEKRLTLSQIYDWMIRNVPFFSDKGENNSSAGWKNSIRHNLSLHKKFHRIKNDGMGKSSWWTVNAAAGSGRIPRRKVPYRRRRGKALVPQHQLENLPSLFRNNKYSVQSRGLPQRNVWSGRAPWNALKLANEPLKTIFQSTASVDNSSSNHSKMLHSNISSVSALYDKSWKANIHLPSLNRYQSEKIFTTQTLSLTEMNSYSNCNSFKRAYLHEQYIFQQMSSNAIPNKTVSTEYFRSPHHLSGSYITEVGSDKIGDVNATATNLSENFFQSSAVEKFTKQISPQVCDLGSKELDLLLCPNNQQDISNFRAVFQELCSETNTSELDDSTCCDSVVNQLIDQQDDNNSNIINEESSTNFRDINEKNKSPLALESTFIDTILPKVHSEKESISTSFLKPVFNSFNLSSSEKVPLSFNDEMKSEDGSDILSFLGITSVRPGSECINEIIQRLHSPKPEHTQSEGELDEGGICDFIENQSISDDENENTSTSKYREVDIPCDTNSLLKSPISEVMNISPNHVNNSSNCISNVLDQHLNSPELMQFLSEESTEWNSATETQWNSANDFPSYLHTLRIGEIDKEREKIPSIYKETDNTNSFDKSGQFPESMFGLISKSESFHGDRESTKATQNRFPITNINDDILIVDESGENKEIDGLQTSHSNTDFIYDPFLFVERAIQDQHTRNGLDLSTDLEVLQTLEALNESYESVTENMPKDNFCDKVTFSDMNGLINKDCRDEKNMPASYPLSHPSEFSNNSDIFVDVSGTLINANFPCLFVESPKAFQNFDHSMSPRQQENMKVEPSQIISASNEKEAYVIEDSILYYLKDDILLDEFLNYVESDAETDPKNSSSFT